MSRKFIRKDLEISTSCFYKLCVRTLQLSGPVMHRLDVVGLRWILASESHGLHRRCLGSCSLTICHCRAVSVGCCHHHAKWTARCDRFAFFLNKWTGAC